MRPTRAQGEVLIEAAINRMADRSLPTRLPASTADSRSAPGPRSGEHLERSAIERRFPTASTPTARMSASSARRETPRETHQI